MDDSGLRDEIINNNEQGTEKGSGEAASVLMEGVTILAIAGIVSKIFGAVFRIPLTNLIGAEGQSYYGVAYPIYQLFYVIAAAGFPLAVSRMVSERAVQGDYINAHKTFKLAFKATTAVCVAAFLILFFGADLFASFYKNEGAAPSIKAVSFALLFTSVVASLRGYYQGMQNMKPTALSEVVEQMVRVAAGLGLAYAFYKTNLEMAAAGATFGASAGIFVTMLVLLLIYFKDRSDRQTRMDSSVIIEESDRERFKEMINIIIPVTLGSSIMPIMMIIDASIIMRRLLATGWEAQEARTLYGLISGYCDPLVNMPVVFIEAVCISLLPAVTRSFTIGLKDELNNNIKTGLKTMMIIAFPCAVGLSVLAGPILRMLYPMHPDEADMAVPTLIILSAGIVLLSTMRILSSSLQGIGRMSVPVINLFIGAVVKIAMSYILVGIRILNINGAALGSVATYLVASVLNYRALRRYENVEPDFKDIFLKPLISAAIMGMVTIVIYKISFALLAHNSVSALISIIAAVIVYFVMIFKTGTLGSEEMKLIPKGDAIYRFADRLHLVK